MISFRFKNQVKRVKIKTKQKLDERMSHWLQKVFSFKNQIIGFKAQDNKVYDVESFYNSVDKFFGSNVDIVQAGDQVQISFTSQNLNSSSFIRPSQPNTSQINHKQLSEDQFDDFIAVSDRKSFQKKLIDGKDISLLFDINAIYRKTLLQNSQHLVNVQHSFKINLYMYINNSHPKKSCLSIYIGKTCVITFPLLKNYIDKVKTFFSRYKTSSVLAERQNKLFLQARASHQQQDQAPSFTTYHLQQRLNQEACIDYLSRMYKQEKSLRNFEYKKLMQKCEQNFSDFYRIFCEGVMDNDYESFRNQIIHKVQNNLQLILSNVDQMDLSRPISRQQQRRNNLKRSVPQIQIVKVENYFQILDQLKNQIDSQTTNEIKQLLLDEDQEICGFFSQYLSRQITQQVLSFRLNNAFSKRKTDKNRPNSRYLPSRPIKSKSVDPVRRKYSSEKSEQVKFNTNTNQIQNNIEEPPMFGSIKNDENCSPIKYVLDIQSNYKQAQNKFSQKGDQFQAEQYGLLYYYLQKRDDSISNFIQQLEWNEEEAIKNIKKTLKQKIQSILMQNFTPVEINLLQSIRTSNAVNCIYQNFKYQWDLHSFISNLKEEVQKNKSISSQIKILHKKSSDSQLLQNREKKNNRYGRRKFSDQNNVNIDPRSPSPKDSQYSLYNKNPRIPDLIQSVKSQWGPQFQEMLKDINFTEERKQQLIRNLYQQGNAKVFGWVRNYIKGHQQYFSSQQIYDLKQNQTQVKFLLSVLPIYDQFLRLFIQDGFITEKIRKWIIGEILSQNMGIISAFELYLQTKQQADFIETLNLIYQNQDHDMEFYKTYIKRLESLLKEMSINDEIGLEVFAQFPQSIKALCQLYFITGNLEDMMDTLEVLYKKQSELRHIKVATLNFSDINTSPFQYHDGSQEADKLNQLFQINLKKQRPQLKKWKIGKIDKQCLQRMSLSYTTGFQLAQDEKLPSRAQFEEIWRKKFPQDSKLKNPPKEQQKIQCIELDYTIYLSALQFLYGQDKSVDVEASIKSLDPNILLNYLKQKKDKPQCNIQVKQQKTMEYMLRNSIDVFFLQQAGIVDWSQELVKQYAWVKNNGSVIIYKKQKIGHIKANLMQNYSNQLNFNNDSACFFSDKGYLLVSGHLKSGKEHIQQAKKMFQTLQNILVDHPMLKLIIGIDANHFIGKQNFAEYPEAIKIKMAPETNIVPTTLKKRTFLQAQYQKSNIQVSEVKDLVITNRNIEAYRIQNIEGQQVTQDQTKQNVLSKPFIPNNRHPYDHFIVTAQIN